MPERSTGLPVPAQPAQQVGAGGVVGVIAGQRALESIDGGRCHLRAVELRDRDGPTRLSTRSGCWLRTARPRSVIIAVPRLGRVIRLACAT